ncbi:hypothetical protein ACFV2X_47910 [Streptomyces sp. NPDC059679]|uniref:hypothetical protein n=1 Tax=Streptomyces sp. NPDC059679 TaxID=3346903 RepID=UPI00369269E4
MHMHTDDEVYAVDDVFLGPSHQTLPWRVRYRAYGIGAAIYALVLTLEIAVGFLSGWNAVYGLLFTIWTTIKIMDHVDHERGAKAVTVAFWHEVSAPRPRTSGARRARLTFTSVRRAGRRTR